MSASTTIDEANDECCENAHEPADTHRILVAAAALAAVARTAARRRRIVVGGKNFTEQQIMARDDRAAAARPRASRSTSEAGMGTAPLRQAQENGQIDVYWEYTGTSLITFNKITDKLDAGDDLREGQGARRRQGPRLAQSVEGQQHLRARDAQGRCAKRKGIATIRDLAAKVKGGAKLKFALQRRVLCAARRPEAAASRPTASSSAATTSSAWTRASSIRR